MSPRVQGLIVLTGAIPGIRDLMWVNNVEDILGYIPFRSEDRGSNWRALTDYPVPGNRYRDATALEVHTYDVLPEDWVESGESGRWILRAPGAPIFSEIVSGRAILASQPKDVQVLLNGTRIPVSRVDGSSGDIWLPTGVALVEDGNWKAGYLTLPGSGDAVQIIYSTLANFVDPTPESRSYYTVVPVRQDGTLAHQPGLSGTEVVNILEVDKMDYIQEGMVGRSSWVFDFWGEPAHLLIRRTKGVLCGCLQGGQARTACESCYETGIVGGYYGPYDMMFIDPDQGTTRELDEGGVKVTRQSRSYLGPTPVIMAGDMIVRKNGERLVISAPVYKSPRGVLMQQDFDVNLIPSGDTRYRVPLRPPVEPTVYNPRFTPAPPAATGEPVVNPQSNPVGKPWENSQVPVGRTIVFGNVQT